MSLPAPRKENMKKAHLLRLAGATRTTAATATTAVATEHAAHEGFEPRGLAKHLRDHDGHGGVSREACGVEAGSKLVASCDDSRVPLPARLVHGRRFESRAARIRARHTWSMPRPAWP